jgi:hypothetical protein
VNKHLIIFYTEIKLQKELESYKIPSVFLNFNIDDFEKKIIETCVGKIFT